MPSNPQRSDNPSADPQAELNLRVVSYIEDGLWVSHCLEMDLIGCGASRRLSMKELKAMVESQFQFALDRDDPSVLIRPAPPQYFDMWEAAQKVCFSRAFKQLANSTGKAGLKSNSTAPVATVLKYETAQLKKIMAALAADNALPA